MSSAIQTATVVLARQLTPNVRELTLSAPPFAYLPGQWISLRLPVGERPPLIRAYTLADVPKPDGTLTLCFDRVENGLGSEYLWAIEAGMALNFTGPLGNFVIPDGDAPLLFVAQYTGIVPFLAILRGLQKGEECAFCMNPRARKNRSTPIKSAHSPPNRPISNIGPRRTRPEVLRESAASWMPFTPMACGVREFTRPVREILMETCGFERRQVKLENYSGAAG